MKTRQVQSFLLFLASFYIFLLFPLIPLWAQGRPSANDDLVGPTIVHDPSTRPGRVGETLTIKAMISDENGVEKVTLFYRRAGESNYLSLRMTLTGDRGYSATIPGQDVRGPNMEYHIQAYDKFRNRSMRGVEDFPLTLTVLAPLLPKKDLFSLQTAGNKGASDITLKKPWYKKWWVWAITVAVVGGAVAAGSGGGGGSNGNSVSSGTGTTSILGPLP